MLKKSIKIYDLSILRVFLLYLYQQKEADYITAPRPHNN